ncbi:hypothetical protein [Saccharopolyspora oryzae]|uniref:WXG100 family type VII secretion target n=1 Tax=Saccharopolyspora oryzae TaxID=2997343 RepID=A0ABT4V2C6_9PSEU|nr:hypothetical protein [Saccharopolyspora oryzae]MDA3628114.1 hypothetical protein [Saccharopolyspora oryzae]
MTDRFYADPDGLARGGANLEQWSMLAKEIAAQMRNVTTAYRHAGGTGEMGEQFNTNYKPGETKAIEFLSMLEEAVGGHGERTLKTARSFSDTNDEADAAAPRE